MEEVLSAFKVNGKALKRAKEKVKAIDEDAEDEEVSAFLVWCHGDSGLESEFLHDAEAWNVFNNLKKIFKSGPLFQKAMEKRSDTDVIASAKFEISSKGNQEKSTGPSKEERTRLNREKAEKEREEEERRKEEELEKQRQTKIKQDQEARQEKADAYKEVSMTHRISKVAWTQAVAEYVRSRNGDISVSETGTRSELVEAMEDWASQSQNVRKIAGAFTGISKFKAPQDKASLGKSGVGDTLDTRSWQANFIIFLGKYGKRPWVNVHVDMVGK